MDFSNTSFAKVYETTKETTELFLGVNEHTGEDMVLVIAEAQNDNHRRISRKYQKSLERAKGDEAKRLIHCEIIGRAILVSWKGFTDDDGTPIEPTVENRISILKKFPRLLSDVVDEATNIKNFQDEVDAEAEKN